MNDLSKLLPGFNGSTSRVQ